MCPSLWWLGGQNIFLQEERWGGRETKNNHYHSQPNINHLFITTSVSDVTLDLYKHYLTEAIITLSKLCYHIHSLGEETG